MVKKTVTTYVDEELWQEFVNLSVWRSMKEEGYAYGAIAKAVEEALKLWIEKQRSRGEILEK